MEQFKPHGKVVFDVESTGLNAWVGDKVFLLGLEDEQGHVLLARPNTKEWQLAKKVLENPAIEKIGHNSKFDLGMCDAAGIKVNGLVHDTMLLAFMNNEYSPSLKLKEIAARELNMPANEEATVKKELAKINRQIRKDIKETGIKVSEANYSDLPDTMIETYLEGDLDRTLKIFWKYEHIITGPQRRVYNIERELIPNVATMEKRGVMIDVKYCKNISSQLIPRMKELEKQMITLAGIKFDFNSPAQLTIVMESLGLSTGALNANGTMGTGVNHMKLLEGNPFIDCLMEWRSLHKLEGTYFQPFIEKQNNSILHASFWPFGQDEGIKTGRFSMSNPNLQNIPAGQRKDNVGMRTDGGMVRRAFIPRPGYAFLFGDYSQVEFKVFSCLVGDTRILTELKKGTDFHLATAYLLFGKNCMVGKTKEEQKRIRFKAKELNFSFLYGLGIKRFALRNNCSIQEATAAKNRYFAEIPSAKHFMMNSQVTLLRDGYVQDLFGRRYHVPQDRAYKAANALCQGTSALILKNGINKTFKKLKGLDACPILTIHDEIVVECAIKDIKAAKVALEEGMADLKNFPIPITADISVATTNWAEKHAWEDSKYAKPKT